MPILAALMKKLVRLRFMLVLEILDGWTDAGIACVIQYGS